MIRRPQSEGRFTSSGMAAGPRSHIAEPDTWGCTHFTRDPTCPYVWAGQARSPVCNAASQRRRRRRRTDE
eukprot:8021204-Pyramimonas_sp.AAC.1